MNEEMSTCNRNDNILMKYYFLLMLPDTKRTFTYNTVTVIIDFVGIVGVKFL